MAKITIKQSEIDDTYEIINDKIVETPKLEEEEFLTKEEQEQDAALEEELDWEIPEE